MHICSYFKKLDWRFFPVIISLMFISLLIISSMDFSANDRQGHFFGPKTLGQLKHFILGWGVFFLVARYDYAKLKDTSILLYGVVIVALLGVFFVPSIQNVHRWYRVPFIGMSLQPSEYAKPALIIILSSFLDKKEEEASSLKTAITAISIIFLPFILILKEPDLGTALVLIPITLGVFYLGNVKASIVKIGSYGGLVGLLLILAIFIGPLAPEVIQPYAQKILKPYQYARLMPNNHHQWASVTAIGTGGVFGKGWRSGDFAGRGWLPYAHTDSVFSAFGEEFGLVGMVFLLGLFYSLIYFSCQITAVAKDSFGRLLSAGITVYMAVHILINIGMMCGLLPVTGVPLIMVSYGGSSVVATMGALGLLQSVYSRRFTP
ncbi:FtsW/RodA/SpoVE family cell cycle protein [Candidatus Clavichlamydia salmonicola]|uniref:FtsW/RodA/SpoVE family cell cycle protein n=1 Tax=Candidatus Clavichlamydia salmonicola TaxID=469812 RepID=UPI0018915CA1|nr:FtsW/RodA/SpoVE family cell cycle protein [Candidatus Clavichlamydia salmonicola]